MNDTTKPSEYLGYWGEKYKNDLLTDILPFWLKYGIDHENGGYFTCLDRDGSLLDTNKSVWFQGRFAFILAYAYNNLEKQAEWLEACKNGIDFIEKYCFDTDGRMFYEVTKTGTPVRKRRYVFSETFAAIAMAQYSIASGDKSYAEKAVKLFKQILYYKNTPGALEPKFREGFVAKGHSFCMILIDTAARIREAVDDPVLTRQIDESIAELRRDFMKPEFKAILETVGPNGEFIDSIPGRTINPGHYGSQRSLVHPCRTFADHGLSSGKNAIISCRNPHDRALHRTGIGWLRSNDRRSIQLGNDFPLVRDYRNRV